MILFAGLVGCVPQPDPCQGVDDDIRFEDRDLDGRGNPDRVSVTCPALQPQYWVADNTDCDDTEDQVYQWAPELCDGLDNNCDGLIDNGLEAVDFFLDLDEDGFGTDTVLQACQQPVGTALVSGDCDDRDPAIHPGAIEQCDGLDNDCDGRFDGSDEDLDPATATLYWIDLDRDGFGDPLTEVLGCELPANAVENADDCDDTERLVHPGAFEVCNSIDDDCDDRIDDSDPDIVASTQRLWYLDADQDGYGDPADAVLTCTAPWFRVLVAGDCDDTNPLVLDPDHSFWLFDHDGDGFGAGPPSGPTCTPGVSFVPAGAALDCNDDHVLVHPERLEVCDGLDNDCDGLLDDLDPDIDPQTTLAFTLDVDGDGYGGVPVLSCTILGPSAQQGGDCDDGDAFIFPGADEFCNGLDDNCNGFIDDADPFVDPRDGTSYYLDADGDGYGDPFSSALFCEQPAGRVELASDCDDSNPLLGPPTSWWPDRDGDNVGTGVIFGPSCEAPQPDWVQVNAGEDCDDDEPTIFPAATEICGDDVDQDCDQQDSVCPRASCLEILQDGLSQGDGVYSIAPTGPLFDVWCDMSTDGGGWTLVSSSSYPPDDGFDDYNPTLQTLSPHTEMAGIWGGLRSVLPTLSDIRFSCKQELTSDDMSVDLVFYNSHWYQELTAGTDEEVCFNESNGAGYDQPAPARRDLIGGSEREAGNDWDYGYLEGEDSCSSRGDFTVDFDNRGMDANQNDGTDWGEDDERIKCARTDRGEAWFIFVR